MNKRRDAGVQRQKRLAGLYPGADDIVEGLEGVAELRVRRDVRRVHDEHLLHPLRNHHSILWLPEEMLACLLKEIKSLASGQILDGADDDAGVGGHEDLKEDLLIAGRQPCFTSGE